VTYRNRHECKFVVPESIAQRVLQRVRPFVAPDPHAARSEDHSYTIATLYLDDHARSLYRETVEGLPFRYKLRVRTYDDAPTTPLFLEIKRRHDRVVQKLRCPIPRGLLPAVLAGEPVTLPGATPAKLASLAEFARLAQLRRTHPVAVVRYQRQAYVGLDDQEVRVTVDRRLCAMPTREAAVVLHGPRFVTVPIRGVILELKFTDRMPPWMLHAIRGEELRRQSYSKYCSSLDALAGHGVAAG
jgi:hypothetical protein